MISKDKMDGRVQLIGKAESVDAYLGKLKKNEQLLKKQGLDIVTIQTTEDASDEVIVHIDFIA